jgi:large subunit ribosomal protein L5
MADEEKSEKKPRQRPEGEARKGGEQQKGGEGRPRGKRPVKGGAEAAAAQPEPEPSEPEPKVTPRLKERYETEVVPALMRELKITNRFRVPRLEKIVINMALAEARENVKVLDAAVEELKQLTGQKPVITRARKAISNFKLREGMPIGAMVTLRRERMYEFFDRLVNIALPRVRDFRGVSDKAFDGRGNYSLGLREHTIFPEINLDKVETVKGMTISIITTAPSDFEGAMLLRALGMPMRSAAPETQLRAAS